MLCFFYYFLIMAEKGGNEIASEIQRDSETNNDPFLDEEMPIPDSSINEFLFEREEAEEQLQQQLRGQQQNIETSEPFFDDNLERLLESEQRDDIGAMTSLALGKRKLIFHSSEGNFDTDSNLDITQSISFMGNLNDDYGIVEGDPNSDYPKTEATQFLQEADESHEDEVGQSIKQSMQDSLDNMIDEELIISTIKLEEHERKPHGQFQDLNNHVDMEIDRYEEIMMDEILRDTQEQDQKQQTQELEQQEEEYSSKRYIMEDEREYADKSTVKKLKPSRSILDIMDPEPSPIKICTFEALADIPLEEDLDYFTCKRRNAPLAFFPKRKSFKSELQTSRIEPTKCSSRFLRMYQNVTSSMKKPGERSPISEEKHENSLYTKDEDESELWVQKYSPKHVLDLLTNDVINCEVLQWISSWKACVFGSSLQQDHVTKEKIKDHDKWGRPYKKILLLCGPPGLGKTTMAHVIAKTAGYNVVEVNASDERAGDAVITKLDGALTTQYDISNPEDKKPILVIIDEIDGAVSGNGEKNLIKYLVNLATDTNNARKSGKQGSSRKSGKTLKRPIICICNDPYVSALKPLRDVSLILPIQRPSMNRITRRLKEICALERFQVDMRALATITEQTDGDIRSSLNILQFHSKRKKVLDHEELIRSNSIGQKDINKGLYPLLLDILQAPNWRKGDSVRNYSARLLRLIEMQDDYDRLLQGCFENYLTIKYHDDHMRKVVAAGDWIYFYETVNRQTYSNSGGYTGNLSRYLAICILNFHRYFAGSIKQFVRFPKYDYQMYLESQRCSDVLKSFFEGLSPRTVLLSSRNTFRLDCLSKIVPLTEPNVKSINPQVMKAHEKLLLEKTIDLMEGFGLTYIQQKDEVGEYEYKLLPAINEILVDFKGSDHETGSMTSYSRTKSYSMRQHISQSIKSRRLVLKDDNNHNPKRTLSITDSQFMSTPKSIKTLKPKDNNSNPNNIMTSSPASSQPTPKMKSPPPKKTAKSLSAFFGRKVVPVTEQQRQRQRQLEQNENGRPVDPSHLASQKSKYWIKFNEGHSNAVRKPFLIRNLFPKTTEMD